MQISNSIFNNITTECTVESIVPLIIRFKFSNVPNDISLSQLMSDRDMGCRVTSEVVNACKKTEGLVNKIFTTIHTLHKINFQIDYLNINSRDFQARYNFFVKSIKDAIDDIKEDERLHNIVSESLNKNDFKIAGMLMPVDDKIFMINIK